MTDAKQVAEEIIAQAKRAREEARVSKVKAVMQAGEVKVGEVKGEEGVVPPTCTPTFVPAQPVTVRSYGNHDITISQGNDQLWYIQSDYLGPIPVLVVVCEGCGFGYPTGKSFFFGIHNFTTGRTISYAQPRMTDKCDMCGWC